MRATVSPILGLLFISRVFGVSFFGNSSVSRIQTASPLKHDDDNEEIGAPIPPKNLPPECLSLVSTVITDYTQCSNAMKAWTSCNQYGQFESTYTGRWKTRTDTITRVFETIKPLRPGHVYTSCDAIPRFQFDPSVTYWNTTTSHVSVTTTRLQRLPMDGRPQDAWSPYPPRCSLPEERCAAVWSSYSSAITASIDGFGDPPVEPEQRFCPMGSWCELHAVEEVALVYWAPEIEVDICTARRLGLLKNVANTSPTKPPRSFTTDAITFRGQDLYLLADYQTGSTIDHPITRVPSSVLRGDFTFISPSVYLAHYALTAHFISQSLPPGFAFEPMIVTSHSMSTSVLRPAGILTLNEDDVQTIMPVDRNIGRGEAYAEEVARGEFKPDLSGIGGPITTTAPLDYGNLIDPVPASVYFDARANDCWGRQSHCGTITDDSYRPKLVLRNRVWGSLFPKDLNCHKIEIVDPPLVLRPLPQVTALPDPGLALGGSVHPPQTGAGVPPGPAPTAMDGGTAGGGFASGRSQGGGGGVGGNGGWVGAGGLGTPPAAPGWLGALNNAIFGAVLGQAGGSSNWPGGASNRAGGGSNWPGGSGSNSPGGGGSNSPGGGGGSSPDSRAGKQAPSPFPGTPTQGEAATKTSGALFTGAGVRLVAVDRYLWYPWYAVFALLL